MFTSKLPFYLELFKSEISTSYQQHEDTFDPESFQGRFHILKCLFLADFIIKKIHGSSDCYRSRYGLFCNSF